MTEPQKNHEDLYVCPGVSECKGVRVHDDGCYWASYSFEYLKRRRLYEGGVPECPVSVIRMYELMCNRPATATDLKLLAV